MTTFRLPDGTEVPPAAVPGLPKPDFYVWIEHPTLGSIAVDSALVDEVKPPLPPEPKPWAAVSDSHGKVWQNIGKEPAPWRCADGRSTNWEALNSAYGPLFRLVPDPADDAPELPWHLDGLRSGRASVFKPRHLEDGPDGMTYAHVREGDYTAKECRQIAAALLLAAREAETP